MKKLSAQFAAKGPHKVQRGDLAYVGLPGRIVTPAAGQNLPAIAFGHDWLQPSSRYIELFNHLASWGIVVIAPDSEKGLVPSHRALARDLRVALDVATGVRLGEGDITVHPAKLGLIGHGMGAGAAILAAAESSESGTGTTGNPRAVAALFPENTAPSSLGVAPGISSPLLVIAPDKARSTHAHALADSWGGPVVSRRVDTPLLGDGILEGLHWTDAVTGGVGGLWTSRKEAKIRKATRTLLTAFLLHHLAGDKSAGALLEDGVVVAGVDAVAV